MYHLSHSERMLPRYVKWTMLFLILSLLLFGLRYYLHYASDSAQDTLSYKENLEQSLTAHKGLMYTLGVFAFFQIFSLFRFLSISGKDAEKLKKAKKLYVTMVLVVLTLVGSMLYTNWNWPA